MPLLNLAATWAAVAQPERVTELVGLLPGILSPAGLLELHVGLGEEEASLALSLETSRYPQEEVAWLSREVASSGGRLHELWRLPRPEREALEARLSRGQVQTYADPRQAAEVLAAHLVRLAEAREPVLTPPPPVRRSHPRFATRLTVVFQTEFDFVLEHATNLSMGGMFVRTPQRPPVDSEVEFEVWLPTGARLEGRGVVRHVQEGPDGGGVGVEFLSGDTDFLQALDAYLLSLA